MKHIQKIISVIMTITLLATDAVPLAYAAQHSDVSNPLINLIPQPEERPLQKAISELSTSTEVTPEVLSLTDNSQAQNSAGKNLPMKFDPLEKNDFKASEEVSVIVNNPDKESLETKVLDTEGNTVPVEVHEVVTGTVTELQIDATDQFTPGKFTIEVSDASGQTVKQDFTWGVLAINPDKSIYLPNETANLSLAVLDDRGDMVCDANVLLTISPPSPESSANLPAGRQVSLSTTDGSITVNPQCHSKQFTLTPDYQTAFKVSGPGEYKLKLEASTGNGSYMIEDKLVVKEHVPFAVKRTSATRIYPPLHYPVFLEITANQDFTGTITETVPESFTVVPAEEANSYDKMNTLYLNSQNDPSKKLEQHVLGTSDGLVMPFDGEYQITQGFGTALTENSLKNFYAHYGLGGHDGIDFGLPSGTPLYAVDDGYVLLAGDGDYGITVVLDHAWGRSYYGHLSKVTITPETHVTKGSLIGYSGNTGESTGPHLHFGMKPANPDTNNGYAGKIDPMPFLPQHGAAVAKTFQLENLQSVLAASTAADKSDSAQTPTPQPEEAKPKEETVQPEAETPEIADQEILAVASPSANLPPVEAYTVQDDVIKKDVAYAASPRIEQVKVIKWQISLKKGETTKLSYAYQAPQVSPQFYTTGPLKFFDKATEQNIFEESRQWQIAADAVGVDWYNKAWPFRKAITIDKDQVGIVQDPWCSIATGATCNTNWSSRHKITINNADIGSNLTNFPLLVVLNSTRIDYTQTLSSGNDLRFVDANGTTLLDYDIEEFNESGNDYVWVEVPQIDANSDADFIWIYYGNSSASAGENASGTWNSNFQAVMHMNENPTTTCSAGTYEICDSTSNGNHGNAAGTAFASGDSITGQVGNAVSFDVDSYFVQTSSSSLNTLTNEFTVSAWIRSDTFTSGQFRRIISRNSTPSQQWFIEHSGTTLGRLLWDGGSPSTTTTLTMSTGTWYYVSMTSSTANAIGRFYIDGEEDVTAGGSSTPAGTTGDIGIAADANGTTPFDGDIDEIRYSNVVRSADWIQAEYLTMTDTINMYGPKETQPSGTVTLTDFPVLINLTSDAQLSSRAQSDGDDILFTDSTGRTKIPHEIESYTAGTGALIAWVQVDSIDDQTDTDIYMYYGNPVATNQEQATSVWDSNYRMVLHMQESSGNVSDSTSNSNTGLNTGTTSSTGQIGNGRTFAGSSSSFLQVTDNSTVDIGASVNFTISLWMRSTQVSSSTTFPLLMWKQSSGGTRTGYAMVSDGFQNNKMKGEMWVLGSTYTATDLNRNDDSWHYITFTRTGSTLAIYSDGNLFAQGTGVASDLSNAANLYLGMSSDGLNTYSGREDEVRLLGAARSSEWIGTEYNNQSSPSTFYSRGSEETYSYAPTNAELMRHGKFFDSSASEQPFAF